MTVRKWLLLAIIFGLAAAYGAPFLSTHSEQDDCTFGPVSNEQYRAYLATARKQLVVIPSLYVDQDGLAARYNALFDSLIRDETDVYTKIAIMHAVLRAAGAEYRNTNGNNADRTAPDPFALAVTNAPTISFNYLLDVNRAWIFSPLLREAWVIGVLAGPRYTKPPGPLYPKKVGGLSFIVHAPDPTLWPKGLDVQRSGSCPAVPASDFFLHQKIKPE